MVSAAGGDAGQYAGGGGAGRIALCFAVERFSGTITAPEGTGFEPGGTGTTFSLDAGRSTLTPLTSTITADGTSTQALTVQTKDSSGANITMGGATVTITQSSGTGSIGPVTDNNDGTYTAIVTAPTDVGSGIFVASVNGLPVMNGATSPTQATVHSFAGRRLVSK